MMLGSVFLTLFVMRACKGLLEAQQPVLLRQLELVDKATTLAASHDVMAYQGIQAMSQPVVGYDGDSYDPSDAAEAKREADRLGIDMEEVNAQDAEQLRTLLA